jgi:hypothetical protein
MTIAEESVTNSQMYIAIGIPCFTMLATLIASVWQSNNVLNQLNLRFASFEQRMAVLESDMKTIVKVVNDLDNRLSRLEERLAR